MKSLITAILILTSTFFLQAQDTIRTKNNGVLVGTIKEIGDEYLTYTRIDQSEGPIRKLSLKDITEVQYKNGTKEIFHVVTTVTESIPKPNNATQWEPGTINNTGKTVIIHRKGPDRRINPGERFPAENDLMDRILGSGVYIDGMIGYGNISRLKNNTFSNQSISDQNVAFGIRFGSKYYFGTHEKRRFGLNIAWAGLTSTISESGYNYILFNPVNIGPSMAFKIKQQTGIEVNTSIGMVVSNIYKSQMGIKYGFDIKWRYNSLALGLDFSRSDNVFGSSSEYSNIFSFTAGVKF